MFGMVEEAQRKFFELQVLALRIQMLGYVFAFLAVCAFCVVAVMFLAKGAATQGASILATAAVSITGLFITG